MKILVLLFLVIPAIVSGATVVTPFVTPSLISGITGGSQSGDRQFAFTSPQGPQDNSFTVLQELGTNWTATTHETYHRYISPHTYTNTMVVLCATVNPNGAVGLAYDTTPNSTYASTQRLCTGPPHPGFRHTPYFLDKAVSYPTWRVMSYVHSERVKGALALPTGDCMIYGTSFSQIVPECKHVAQGTPSGQKVDFPSGIPQDAVFDLHTYQAAGDFLQVSIYGTIMSQSKGKVGMMAYDTKATTWRYRWFEASVTGCDINNPPVGMGYLPGKITASGNDELFFVCTKQPNTIGVTTAYTIDVSGSQDPVEMKLNTATDWTAIPSGLCCYSTGCAYSTVNGYFEQSDINDYDTSGTKIYHATFDFVNNTLSNFTQVYYAYNNQRVSYTPSVMGISCTERASFAVGSSGYVQVIDTEENLDHQAHLPPWGKNMPPTVPFPINTVTATAGNVYMSTSAGRTYKFDPSNTNTTERFSIWTNDSATNLGLTSEASLVLTKGESLHSYDGNYWSSTATKAGYLLWNAGQAYFTDYAFSIKAGSQSKMFLSAYNNTDWDIEGGTPLRAVSVGPDLHGFDTLFTYYVGNRYQGDSEFFLFYTKNDSAWNNTWKKMSVDKNDKIAFGLDVVILLKYHSHNEGWSASYMSTADWLENEPTTDSGKWKAIGDVKNVNWSYDIDGNPFLTAYDDNDGTSFVFFRNQTTPQTFNMSSYTHTVVELCEYQPLVEGYMFYFSWSGYANPTYFITKDLSDYSYVQTVYGWDGSDTFGTYSPKVYLASPKPSFINSYGNRVLVENWSGNDGLVTVTIDVYPTSTFCTPFGGSSYDNGHQCHSPSGPNGPTPGPGHHLHSDTWWIGLLVGLFVLGVVVALAVIGVKVFAKRHGYERVF